jgi:hypothetical protein
MKELTTTYYYIEPSNNGTSGLSKMAEVLVEEAKKSYSHSVWAEQAIREIIVGYLRMYAGQLLQEHPRWKEAKVSFTINDFTGNGMLRIDGWNFTCYKISYISMFKEDRYGKE